MFQNLQKSFSDNANKIFNVLSDNKSSYDYILTLFKKEDYDFFDKTYLDISHSILEIDNHFLINFYSENHNQTLMIKELIDLFNAKYFISETKTLPL